MQTHLCNQSITNHASIHYGHQDSVNINTACVACVRLCCRKLPKKKQQTNTQTHTKTSKTKQGKHRSQRIEAKTKTNINIHRYPKPLKDTHRNRQIEALLSHIAKVAKTETLKAKKDIHKHARATQ